jgi:hypothetical protein
MSGEERLTRAQLLGRRVRAQREPDERVVAEGRLRRGGYIVVTDRRLIWTVGREVESLALSQILRAQEIFEESHRYRLRLFHEPIDRQRDVPLPWDLPRHLRRWTRRKTWNRTTNLPFSRADTEAAEAIRHGLARTGVIMLESIRRPHTRDEADTTLYRIGPIRSWWYRRRLRGAE